MSLSQDQIIKVDALYTDPSKGLTTFKKVYDYLKSQGETGYTLQKIKDYLGSLQVNQVLTKRRGDVSFVADGPLQQFQIDLVYMKKSWFNNGYKYILLC